jgi:cysteinyl-tRNA synthetase
MLDIDGEKMSKSLGNFRTIEDVLAVIDPLTLRYFLISARYRDKLDFTEDNLNKCRSAVERLMTANREARRVLQGATADDGWEGERALKALYAEFADAMDDDFNTPGALGALNKAVTHLNTVRTQAEAGQPKLPLARGWALLHDMREALGLGEKLEPKEEGLDAETERRVIALAEELVGDSSTSSGADAVQSLIDRRMRARKEKDFQLADSIRNRLATAGIVLEDKPGETIWRRG